MEYEVGFDILLWGMNQPIQPFNYNNTFIGNLYNQTTGEMRSVNYYNLNLFKDREEEALLIRVLGLQGYYSSALESNEVNAISIKYPYVYHRLLIDAHPLNTLDDEAMELFYKAAKLNTKQYKYLAVEGNRINTPYPILSKIPKGHAMLISDTGDFQPDFDYTKVQRSFKIPIRSYFPMRLIENPQLETDWIVWD